MNHDRYLRIIRGEDRTAAAGVARLGLRVMEGPYRAAVALRNGLFNVHARQGASLGRPTISVGNLTAGGTGKTPFVIEVVHRLCEMGHRPAVLLRGYGDDETRELRSAFAGGEAAVPVEANPKRAEQAADLLKREPGVSVFVLDDAFQHRQVQRDLDLVLIDATQPFGHGHVLPRGLLREPIGNLRRADAVIVTRSDQVSADALSRLDTRIEEIAGAAPLAHTATGWCALRQNGEELPIDVLHGKRVMGACGIGNPGAFERQLRASAGTVMQMAVCNDHHAWTADDLRALLRDADQAGAEAVVITEKDWVKWQPLLEQAEFPRPAMPIWRPALAVQFLDGEQAYVTLLQEVVGAYPEP